MYDRPKARTEGVVVEWADDELIIFDQESQMAHCLAAEAALVWERCDGRRSRVEIAQELALDPNAVARAVDELGGCGLLDDGAVGHIGYSRREAALRMAKVGGAALVAPLIYSVAIPAAAAAASCTANNAQFTTGTCSATTLGSFGVASATAKCCSGTGASSCYKAKNGVLYCTDGTCAITGDSCNTGSGGKPCCAGGGQGNGVGDCGTGNKCTN